MAEENARVVPAHGGNAKAKEATPKRFWAIDNEGQLHWGASEAEALREATEANISLRENH